MVGPRRGSVRPDNSKVPDITPWFWAIKLLTTAMGEAISDYLAARIDPYLAVLIGLVIWVIGMAWVLRTPRYKISAYWFGVSSVAVFGTMCADGLHIQFGVPYAVTSLGFAICLTIVLTAWYRTEHTLDIHSITTRRREVFYWLTVISTFALGTALGDLIATPLHLGFLTTGILFSVLILIPLAAWLLGANPVLTFWVAYILTRPIGASFADFFGQPKSLSGMGYGHPVVFLITGVLVIALVSYLKVTGKDLLPRRGGGSYPAAPAPGAVAPGATAPAYAPQAPGGYPPAPSFSPRPDQGAGRRQDPPPGNSW
ncbi:MAG TPA: hypothetical protein VK817_10920 [Trebonia sp.]|jgi:uncharacterized membrane-anchored protein|nr:hypothetical protein [Trebonia sp.]